MPPPGVVGGVHAPVDRRSAWGLVGASMHYVFGAGQQYMPMYAHGTAPEWRAAPAGSPRRGCVCEACDCMAAHRQAVFAAASAAGRRAVEMCRCWACVVYEARRIAWDAVGCDCGLCRRHNAHEAAAAVWRGVHGGGRHPPTVTCACATCMRFERRWLDGFKGGQRGCWRVCEGVASPCACDVCTVMTRHRTECVLARGHREGAACVCEACRVYDDTIAGAVRGRCVCETCVWGERHVASQPRMRRVDGAGGG